MPRKQCAVFSDGTRFSKLKKPIERVLFFTFSSLKKQKVFCEVYCINNAKMRSLNRSFRGKNDVATVLSFPADIRFPRPDVPKSVRYLGEIYIAPLAIEKKGEWPIGRYIIHGALHLLGYTHARQSDRIEMESLEAEVASYLKKKGVL